ncbi:hypothetical protein [Naasia lichenicola]|uniref:Uncharacterized protein n=1 Tax=Naasia lichenicola TaxID=2565933 RepID=A0A4S4FJZ3_9MICO|nr:hypothetical protein [Naasia lichenicola]THG30690.1 hypothetical protein E6C64_08600 [Naasia lichenicola]THG31927.1 hypothetical protein E6C64_07745 [Naasia lichenicola]
MSDDQPHPVRKRVSTAARWLTDESFWKDVTTRTMAGLIVVFVAWGVGVASGALSSVEGQHAFSNVLQLVFIFIGAVFAVYLVRRGTDSTLRTRVLGTIFVVCGALVFIVTGLLVLDFVAREIVGSPIGGFGNVSQ